MYSRSTPGALDHFVSYGVKASKSGAPFVPLGPVTLAGTFGSADYDVAKPAALALPGDKNDEGTHDADTPPPRRRRAGAGELSSRSRAGTVRVRARRADAARLSAPPAGAAAGQPERHNCSPDRHTTWAEQEPS